MDTNVPAVEPGEDVMVNLEGDSMAHPEAPSNPDVALFKQQMSQVNSTFGAGTSASKLNAVQQQTEDLIELSEKFKSLLENDASGKIVANKASSSPTETIKPTDREAATQGFPVDIKPMVSKNVEHKEIPLGKSDHDASTDSNAKTSTFTQDTAYISPQVTPSIAHSSAVQNASPLEVHAAMISQQIKDQVIDRILVSTNDIAANKIVKVVISPNVLQGTEVNFQKIGDVLSVQFASRNEGSLQFLQVNQADLQGYLQGELKQFKSVSVSVKASGNSTEYPDDGRSRNRYEYQAPDEDEQ